MKLKLSVTLEQGGQVHVVYTNLLCIAEWEEKMHRKVTDGRGIGIGDMAFWAHHLLKLGGIVKDADYKAFLASYPDVDIQVEDTTNPNPTSGEPTDDN